MLLIFVANGKFICPRLVTSWCMPVANSEECIVGPHR